MAGDELLARIAEHPDDDGAYLVYADDLTGRGDPHGELIVLMHQLAHATDDEQRGYLGNALDAFQTKHRAKLFGDLGKHQGIGWDFHLGFLRSVHVLPDIKDELPALVKQILGLPIARFLRELLLFDRWEHQRKKVEAVVRKHKPSTLDGVAFAKRYEDLDAATAERGAVQWLAIELDEVREQAAIAKLPHLEWLEISGTVEQLSGELAALTKLRRLDIDWCTNLRAIADEIFGIESLAYISAYDTGLPKTYHMGRLNSLLFGFSRARTPSRRRIIELDLLLGNDAKVRKLATRGDLFAALDNNVGAVREGALRLLAEKLDDPFAKRAPPAGASFALIGKTNLDKKEITARLRERGIALAHKIDDATTHVILGVEPGGRQAAIGDRPIVLDTHLQQLFSARPARPAKAARPAASRPGADRDAIEEGLRSGDEAQTAAAVAAIATFDAALLPDLVVVLSDTTLGKSRDAAKKLVALHAPKVKAAFDAHLKSSVLNTSMGETKRAERLLAFARQAEVDGLALAMLLLARAGLGFRYVSEHGTSADVTRALELIAARHGGTKLDLSTKELREVPAEIAKLAKVEEVDLSNNHFSTFPAPVLAMKSLVRLRLSSNRIGKIPDAIASSKLVLLDISRNRWRRFPAAVLEIPTLEELDVSSSREYIQNEARIDGMPAGIGKLTKLRRFDYRFNVLGAFPDALWKLPLEELHLGWCDLPAEIPPQLGKLKKLEKLSVMYSTWVDKAPQLKKLLPNCEIET